MKYIALLRGINVGGNRRVEMKRLKALLESLGYENVSTYINSGNVIFESGEKQREIGKEIASALKKEFGFDIGTLVKSEKQMKSIANAIPKDWQNDSKQKTDVAYLFKEIDSEETIAKIPAKREYIDIRYTEGAVYWNIDRKNYGKCQINKLIGYPIYKLMTVRNINTARFLAGRK
jgi:uncharacterized protein (DUF1697 family)